MCIFSPGTFQIPEYLKEEEEEEGEAIKRMSKVNGILPDIYISNQT